MSKLPCLSQFCQRRLFYFLLIIYYFSTVRWFKYYPVKKRPPLSRQRNRDPENNLQPRDSGQWQYHQQETWKQWLWKNLIFIELEYYVPGTCGVLCTPHILSHLTCNARGGLLYYYAHFTGENRHRESEQWGKDSNPGALRSRAHSLWLEAGGGKPGLKLNPFQVIHWSFGQWRDEDL